MIRKETTEIYITSDGDEFETLQEAQEHEIFQGCLTYFTDLILPDYCETEKYETSMVHEISNAVLENKEFLLKLLSENSEVEEVDVMHNDKFFKTCNNCKHSQVYGEDFPCNECNELLDRYRWEAK